MVSDYKRRRHALRIAVGIAVLAILLFVGSTGTAAINTPTITSITPTSGVGGMAITINGQNFGTNPGTVYFGDTPANLGQPNDENGKLKWSDTKIVAPVPIGIGTVQVNVKETKGAKSNGVPFTYLDVPIVSQWRWPRDNAVPIDGWGYGDETIYGIHTGIDTYEEKRGIITSVFAAADGIVVAKCPDGKKCDGFSNNANKDNHQLFGVVILAHRRSDDGTLVYSLYGDMKDVSNTPEPGTKVNMGDILGLPGITRIGLTITQFGTPIGDTHQD